MLQVGVAFPDVQRHYDTIAKAWRQEICKVSVVPELNFFDLVPGGWEDAVVAELAAVENE